jgi:hypothetical protein
MVALVDIPVKMWSICLDPETGHVMARYIADNGAVAFFDLSLMLAEREAAIRPPCTSLR